MNKFRSWDELEQQLLKDPAVKKAYDNLEPSYMVATNLIRARLDKKLTQKEVTDRAGVSKAVVMRLESAVGNPRAQSINRVAEVFDLRLALVDKGHEGRGTIL